ncbi:MAG: hypothetical protein R3C59_29830 [Planctomycetaceae bacterium]
MSTAIASTAQNVIELMHGLLGLDVVAAPAADFETTSIAEYVDEDGAVAGYISCDLATSCRLGAALTQVPAGRADEAMKEGAIPENLSENMDEIFNISVNLITSRDGRRIRLGQIVHCREDDTLTAARAAMVNLRDELVSFNVARYGLCRMRVTR